MGRVVMYSSVSVDGFIGDDNDQPGPLFDWSSNGDVLLDESDAVKVSQTSYDYTRPYWGQIGVTLAGRHVFDLTDGWDGKPPSGIDHVVVVTHRPQPEGWDPETPFHFVDGVEAAMAKAQEPAGDRIVEVAAGEVGGQVLAAAGVDEVRMDVYPSCSGPANATSGRSTHGTSWRIPTWLSQCRFWLPGLNNRKRWHIQWMCHRLNCRANCAASDSCSRSRLDQE